MSQIEKLKEKIRARPPEARFEDVRKLLELYGYEERRQRGSHVIFGKPRSPSITVPIASGQKVKRTYLVQLCELLGLDD
jgi:predicted RNA binding protein YcfA (HicA-like mRNA interferase family)